MCKSALIAKKENYRAIYYNKTLSLFLMWCCFFFSPKVISLNVFFFYLFAIFFILFYQIWLICKNVLIAKKENYRAIYYIKTSSLFLIWCFFFFYQKLSH